MPNPPQDWDKSEILVLGAEKVFFTAESSIFMNRKMAKSIILRLKCDFEPNCSYLSLTKQNVQGIEDT